MVLPHFTKTCNTKMGKGFKFQLGLAFSMDSTKKGGNSTGLQGNQVMLPNIPGGDVSRM